MKQLFLLAIVMFLGLTSGTTAWAGGGGSPSNGSGVTCSASDSGWEEHWGGHGSCSSCLAKHGNCTERCTQSEYECTAEGELREGQVETVSAYDRDEYYARDRALERCYRSRLRGCRVTGCTSQAVEVSSRTCH